VPVRGIYTAHWTGEGPLPGIFNGDIYSALDWRRPVPGICKGEIYSALDWRRVTSRYL